MTPVFEPMTRKHKMSQQHCTTHSSFEMVKVVQYNHQPFVGPGDLIESAPARYLSAKSWSCIMSERIQLQSKTSNGEDTEKKGGLKIHTVQAICDV